MGLAGMSFQLTPALAIKVFGTAGGFLAFLHGSDIGPVTYRVTGLLKRLEAEDYSDYHRDFNPFSFKPGA
jgi:hypothetical protein